MADTLDCIEKEMLIDKIYEQLGCNEPQTKEIIDQFLSDIKLFDKKHGDYGPRNIDKFGIMGILVRSSDKIERLINLHEKSDSSPLNTDESVVDSWADLSVYGAIARAVEKGNWNV
jgi:hypothetical protein